MTLRAIDIVQRWTDGALVDIWLRRNDGSPILLRAGECRIEPHMKAGPKDLLILGACADGRLFASNTTRDEFSDSYMFDLGLQYENAIKKYMTQNRRCLYWASAVSQLLRPKDELILLDDVKQPREYKVAKKSGAWYCKSRLVGKRNFHWEPMPWLDAKGNYQPEPEPPVSVGPPRYRGGG